MGARTRNYSQIDSVRRIFVEGDAAKAEYVVSARPRRSNAKKLAAEKLLKQQARIRRGTLIVAAAIFVVLVVTTLSLAVKRNDLDAKLGRMENQLQELREQNDSKEYEINSTVDLDYVVEVATGQLGMVRSQIGQIQTYSSDNSEYTQQLAEIPTK